MGLHSPEEASKIAQRAGFVSSGIPGSNVNAEIAAKLAIEVMNAHVPRSEPQASISQSTILETK